MARRKLSMNEYLEMVYQWHRGRSVRQIRDSLRMSRKTIRKYLRRPGGGGTESGTAFARGGPAGAVGHVGGEPGGL